MSDEYSLESMFENTDSSLEDELLSETEKKTSTAPVQPKASPQPQPQKTVAPSVAQKVTPVVEQDSESVNDAVKSLLESDNSPAVSSATSQAEVTKPMYDKLNTADQGMAVKVSDQLNFDNRDTLMNYASKVTSSIDAFSKKVLENADSETNQANVRRNLHQISSVLRNANVKELLEDNPEQPVKQEKGGFFSNLFGHKETNKLVQGNKIDKFRSVSEKIDILKEQLEGGQQQLSGDIDTLNKLYEQNLNFFKALNIYIAGAEYYNEQLVTQVIPELRQKLANATESSLESERLTRTQDFQNALERKIYDLRLVRQVSLNQAPSIRLIQTNNRNLIDKIQSSITATLPVWRNNFVTVLATVHQRSLAQAQREISDTTNDLLNQGADLLHQTTIETAKENERGIIEIETLQHVQDQLIASIDDTLKIQQEGAQARAESTKKLAALENGLKNKLEEISQRRYE
ncbi:toxic anion resistance protein [Lactiplantibacillus plajomi]|uniref:Toxic anion resistance protein n=1 Tax=Lactiplantibacillus plajomi TaxID=1457217 RepID=A0ABV6K2G0_9LACO|nr:toxic anion resistance protein [Lactiplantibacillus plajomi]